MIIYTSKIVTACSCNAEQVSFGKPIIIEFISARRGFFIIL